MVARNEGVLMAQRTTTNQEKGEKFPEKMLKKKEETVGLWIKKWSHKLWWRIVDDPPLRSQLPKRRIKPTLINIAADKVQKKDRFVHDNALVHTSITAMAKVNEPKLELFPTVRIH